MRLKKEFNYFVCIVSLIIGFNLFALSDAPPTLDIALVSSTFDSQFRCAWEGGRGLKFWVEPVSDERRDKTVGVLLVQDRETPLQATRPVSIVLQRALETGLNKCGFLKSNQRDTADILVATRLTEFSGTSRRGLLKGKVEGRAGLVLNLSGPNISTPFSASFEVAETRVKGVSKRPKKLEKTLNNLLTQLILNVFDSRQVEKWIVNGK